MPVDPALLRRLQQLDLAVGRIAGGEIGGRRASTSRGSGTEFLEHRSYSPGDDLRTIDWNAYARFGEFHVKQFTAEERLHLVLVVDDSPSMDFGRFNKLARARDLAACLGFIALRRLDRVSLVPLGGAPRTYQGRRRTFPFLEHALALGPADPATRIEDLATFLTSLGRRPVVFLLSDLMGDASAEILARIGGLSLRATCLHLVDPLEEDPGVEGRVRLVDSETGRAVTMTIDPPTRALYRERFARHLASAEAACLSRQVGCVRVPTSEDAEATILSTLRRSRILL